MSVLLNTDLISVNIEAPDRNQVLTVMADKLNGVRVAKEGFLDALLKREEIYPTGLPISGGVAIRSDSCLLYTSPSPRDRQKSRMPSSA